MHVNLHDYNQEMESSFHSLKLIINSGTVPALDIGMFGCIHVIYPKKCSPILPKYGRFLLVHPV